MAVTELALLSLKSTVKIDDKSLLKKLAHAKNVLETWTSRPFHFFSQIADPAFIYIIGEWKDMKQHRDDFLPSVENQQLLELLKDQVSVSWLLHIDIDQAKLPLSAPIIAIARHTILPGRQEAYIKIFEAVIHHLETYIAPSHLVHGWRLDKEKDGNEEDILIMGWDSVAHHQEFAQTDGFKEYVRIKEFMDHVEVKHAKRLDF